MFYALNYSIPRVHSVEVGLHDTHLLGDVQVVTHPSTTKTWTGRKILKDHQTYTLIDKKIGCPLCVHVKVTAAFPTELDYTISSKDDVEMTSVVHMDVNLGDNFISWDHVKGWKKVSTAKSVSITPSVGATVGAESDVGLHLKSSMQLAIDKMMWYHLDMKPSFPLSVFARKKIHSEQSEICVGGKPEVSVGHEADLHVTLFGKSHEVHHWGPKEDYHYSNSIHKCKDLVGGSESTLVI